MHVTKYLSLPGFLKLKAGSRVKVKTEVHKKQAWEENLKNVTVQICGFIFCFWLLNFPRQCFPYVSCI
jgi:hypothetical protein